MCASASVVSDFLFTFSGSIELLRLLFGLSSAFFAVPVIENWHLFSLADISYASFGLLTFLAAEAIALRVTANVLATFRYQAIVLQCALALALAVNITFFFYILTGAPLFWMIIGFVILFALVRSSLRHATLQRFALVFASAFPLTSIVWAWHQFPAPRDDVRIAAPRPPNVTSVYVLSFDSLASVEALSKLYKFDNASHVRTLRDLGFDVYDKFSSGEDTLASLGRMFSFGAAYNVRTRSFFNGTDTVPLYEELRNRGYKIGFFFDLSFFGVDADKLDRFHPPRGPAPNVCNLIDERYGFFLCRPRVLKLVFGRRAVTFPTIEDRTLVAVEQLEREIATLNASGSPWFYFAHIWYPGHTDSAYRFSDLAARQRFIEHIGRSRDVLSHHFMRLVRGEVSEFLCVRR